MLILSNVSESQTIALWSEQFTQMLIEPNMLNVLHVKQYALLENTKGTMFASLFSKECKAFGHFPKALAVSVVALLLTSCGGAPDRPSNQQPVTEVQQPPNNQNTLPEGEPVEESSGDESAEEPKKEEQDETKIIQVAIMLPLSGPEAPAGTALLRAATMALFDAYDPRIRLIPYDTQADAFIAEEKAHQAIEDGVSVVLGPLLSDSVSAVGPFFSAENITVIGFSNDSNVAAPGRYIMGFLPEAEVKRVIDYAVLSGYQKFGALIPEGLYGQRVRTAFGDTIFDAGARIEAIESYPPRSTESLDEPVKRLARYDERRSEARREMRFLRGLRDDLTNEIADRIEDAEVLEGVDFDAVLVPEGGAIMRSLPPLLPFYEVDPNEVKLLGTGLWNDPGLLGEPPMQGAWFAAPEPEIPTDFLNRYEEIYGARAPRIATLAYDAMSLVAQLARTPINVEEKAIKQDQGEGENNLVKIAVDTNANSNSRLLFARERMTITEGFVGIDGLFRFLENGEIERSLAVLEVNRSGFVIVDAAPESFPAFGYLLN